jgi:hypothetical protein
VIGQEGIDSVGYRRALEALRSGVPNQDAVRVLGCNQEAVEQAFTAQLDEVQHLLSSGDQAPGLLVAGGFGAGKSHLLEFLQLSALSANFVVSKIVISKETPLYDQGKVFKAAVDNAVLPDRRGQAVKEIAQRLDPRSSAYVALDRWAKNPNNGISDLFPATLFLHERLNNDPDLVESVTDFWAGDPLPVAAVRLGLRQVNAASAFTVKSVPVKQLPHERFTFVTRLILGAGYSGWVLLIDEVELIGRYSLLQRGKSYAELARWMGKADGVSYPGLTVVAAITDDFDINVLQEKGDRDYVGLKLLSRETDEMNLMAARAEVGMRCIARDALELVQPTDLVLGETYRRLREVHSKAYSWDPPQIEGAAVALRRAMRSYVRRWINEWDLKRLDPVAEVHTEEDELRIDYGEDQELEVANEGEPPLATEAN